MRKMAEVTTFLTEPQPRMSRRGSRRKTRVKIPVVDTYSKQTAKCQAMIARLHLDRATTCLTSRDVTGGERYQRPSCRPTKSAPAVGLSLSLPDRDIPMTDYRGGRYRRMLSSHSKSIDETVSASSIQEDVTSSGQPRLRRRQHLTPTMLCNILRERGFGDPRDLQRPIGEIERDRYLLRTARRERCYFIRKHPHLVEELRGVAQLESDLAHYKVMEFCYGPAQLTLPELDQENNADDGKATEQKPDMLFQRVREPAPPKIVLPKRSCRLEASGEIETKPGSQTARDHIKEQDIEVELVSRIEDWLDDCSNNGRDSNNKQTDIKTTNNSAHAKQCVKSPAGDNHDRQRKRNESSYYLQNCDDADNLRTWRNPADEIDCNDMELNSTSSGDLEFNSIALHPAISTDKSFKRPGNLRRPKSEHVGNKKRVTTKDDKPLDVRSSARASTFISRMP